MGTKSILGLLKPLSNTKLWSWVKISRSTKFSCD